ncbi:MAG: MucB/RseB C-terminal domain-containing protein [Gallionella sp.]
MKLRSILFVSLVLLTSNVLGGEKETCADWLKTVAFASHETEYSGVFVYQYADAVETSRITHLTEAGVEYEKLESLDGPQREIIRHHGHVWMSDSHGMVEMNSQQKNARFPSLLPQQLSALSENYQAKLAGKERVAGFDAQVILFQPKDALLYSHKIWVHSESGLLLKAAVLDDKNKMVEQYAFTQLQIGGKLDRSWLKANVKKTFHGEKGHDYAKAKTKTSDSIEKSPPFNSGWVVRFLPSGFKKTTELERPMHGKHLPVTQIVYSDGLSAVSVFIEHNDHDEDDFDGLSSRGAVTLYHKVVGDHLFTVVGEGPPRAIVKVLDSIRYVNK